MDEQKDIDNIEPAEEQDDNRKKIIILIIFLIFGLIFLISITTFYLLGTWVKEKENAINVGSVLFSFNEDSNNIQINNAFPMNDEVGKNLSGEKEYFDFTISVGFNKSIKQELTYEISLIPSSDNSIDPKFIHVYLTENKSDTLINDKVINKYSELKDSTIRDDAKLLYKKIISKDEVNSYVFRMWLAKDYEIDNVTRTFKCFIVVDAY